MSITEGKVHEVTEAQKRECFGLEAGSILAVDRGYIDYDWFRILDEKGIFFVTRTKKNTSIFVTENLPLASEVGVLKDEKVALGKDLSMVSFGHDLRRVTFWDAEKQKEYEFFTNNFDLSAGTIAHIYKQRWQIELFFKWIKQHLKIKSFLGTSKNAVMMQIWVAMIYYLLLSYMKYAYSLSHTLLSMTRMIKEVFMDRIHLLHLLHISPSKTRELKQTIDPPQLSLL